MGLLDVRTIAWLICFFVCNPPASANGTGEQSTSSVSTKHSDNETPLPAAGLNIVHWSTEGTGCSTIYKNGVAYKSINIDGIQVLCSADRNGRYQIANIIIENKAANRVDVLPANSRLLVGAVQILPVTTLDLDNAIAELNEQAASEIEQSMNELKTPRFSFAPGGNARNRAMLAVNLEQQQSKADSIKATTEKHAAGIRALQQELLKANTLFPGDSMSGKLLFPRNDAGGKRSLELTISQYRFLFEL